MAFCILPEMKILFDNGAANNYRIQSYSADSFTINNERITSGILISAKRLIPNWPPQTMADLATQHLETIIALEPEIVLFGTGKRLIFPDEMIISTITSRYIGVEFMDTGAACRSYNLLMSDDRKVVAALLLQGV